MKEKVPHDGPDTTIHTGIMIIFHMCHMACFPSHRLGVIDS